MIWAETGIRPGHVGTTGLQLKNKTKAIGTAMGPDSGLSLKDKEDTQPGDAADGPGFQESSQRSTFFTCLLNLSKFLIYPTIPGPQKPGFVNPQELILLSYPPRANLLETRFLVCYCTVRMRRYNHKEMEPTHGHS